MISGVIQVHMGLQYNLQKTSIYDHSIMSNKQNFSNFLLMLLSSNSKYME